MIERWPLLRRTVRLGSGDFKVEEKVFRSPRTGAEHTFLAARGADWVNVIALTRDERVVLVRQFRQGVERVTLELPGGLVDGGEEPLAAGLRELREETGYVGGRARLLGVVDPNPAILDLQCHTILVEGVEPGGERSLDESEDIDVEVHPLREVRELIVQGRIHHALVITAFALLEASRGGFRTLREGVRVGEGLDASGAPATLLR